MWLAGAKALRFVPAGSANLYRADDVAAALADLLVLVDDVIIRGRKVTLEGLPFPHLAFHEFVETLLLWAVIESVDVATAEVGTIDVVDRCMFNPPKGYVDLLAALLARDWASFVIELEHRFTDPVWALYQRACWPGHAELFLSNVRRYASGRNV